MRPGRNATLLEALTLLGAGGHHLALRRLHLHVLSCFAINVTTGMHIHLQYTESTMPN